MTEACKECGWNGGGVRDEGCIISPCPRFQKPEVYQVDARLSADTWSMSTTEARKLARDLRRAADAVERDMQRARECPSCGGTDTHTSGCAR